MRLPRRRPTTAVLAVGALVLAAQVVASVPAQAATTYTVSTTADIAANAGACGNASVTTAPSPLSLREATCLANNAGGTVTINVPAGNYNLANGELAPGVASGSNVSIVGAGAASTIVNAGGNSRVFDLDKNLVGGVTNTISGLTITGGADGTYGGAGIIGGSNNNTTADALTLNNVIITGNAANGANMAVTNKPGGGVQFLGGTLTITNSTISNNTSGSSYGSGVAYGANGQASPEGLTITNTTFSGNATVNTSAGNGTAVGGALALFGASGTNFSVSGSRFTNNSASSTNGSGPAVGGAIWQQSGTLSVTGSTFTGNSVSGGTAAANAGGAIETTSGTATLRYNRITGNTGTGGVVHSGGTVDAKQNWWGCNAGPGAAGCDTSVGATVAPRLVLSASASPSTVVGPNGTSTITAAFTSDSAGAAVGGGSLGAFAALPATFSDPAGDSTVTLSAGSHTAGFSAGQAAIDYHSGTVTGPNSVPVTFDNQTVSTTVTVNQAPAITSANAVNFRVNQAGSFTVTTTGYPTAAITKAGTLPNGVTFTDNGDGTATIAGTPTGSGGTFPITLTANNGVNPNATQTLTITVGQAPAFTSANSATFTAGAAGSFTVTTSGVPTVSTITSSGTLPAGVSLTDNGNGTATLAGTPTASAGGTYPLTLTATNGVSPNGSQTFTLQVNQAPTVTTNPSSQTVNPGASVSFTAAASGVPTPTVQWQRSTNGGASYTNIAGATSTTYTFTAAAGDNGNTYRAVFTNAAGTATSTAATLTVGTAPAFTSGNQATFLVGTPGTFTIRTSGVPSATLSRTGAQFPSWLTLSDNGDGTGTLTGTPPAGSAGLYTFTLKAANGFSPSASQTFTLEVDQSPVITSADHATFTAGTANSFTVTTTAGFPTTTVITRTGALPAGVTFTDNGDGTATLAGRPNAGTGGVYRVTVTANAPGAAPPVNQNFTLTVNEPPTITSADHATFTVGTAGTFTVTSAAGYPAARTLTLTGALPSGVTFTDNGDGTATLAGTPAVGTGGVHPLTVTASNGISPDAVQTFSLTVNEGPSITSTDDVTFARGVAGSFTVTTSAGEPPATTLTQTGTLPAGVSFTDNGDGTATLAGTPTEDGIFALTVTASNGVQSGAVQNLTLTVTGAAAVTSADHATFALGTAGSFTVTTEAGTPATTTLAATGTLPAGVTFVDNGDGTATLSGTPAAGTGGSYPLTIKAANSAASSTQAFTLTVTALPAITSASSTTFGVGSNGTFTVTSAAGFPSARTLTETGALPSGVTFVDNGDGTATLSGTPAAGVGGSYPLTVTATNSAGHTDQAFTLVVTESPVITSADHATFTTGTDGTFTVTTGAGFPSPPSLAVSGDALPSGLTFTDNGDGTATLSGTPAASVGGSYDLVVTAHNGVDPDASQPFTLVVNQAPAVTSAASATFTVGTAGSFTVTTSGYPAPSLTGSGTLPDGLTFTDNGGGTATIAGTPTTAGDADLTITAANGTAPDATQNFTLHVVKAAQTITVTSTPPSPALVGGSYTPVATSDSGLPVAVTVDASTTASACELGGAVVRFTHAGTCVLDFDQAGNGTYAAAVRVPQSFTVATIVTGVAVTTTTTPTVYGQSVRATAVVTGTGDPAGTVQFAVDGTDLGSPVAVADGTAQSSTFPADLAPGSHAVTATFTPTEDAKYAPSTGTTTQVVNQAATTTSVVVNRTSITATVKVTAPGSGTPTGPVTFTVGGRPVGTAPLDGGTATVAYTVPTGQAQQVGATYAGDANFTMSSASTARNDPKITASVTSAQPRTKYNWYRTPVTITFRCTTNGAPLTAPCPAPVRLAAGGAARTVSKTITATDGGTASVVVGVNLDPTAPTVKVTGVRNGATYLGSAPRIGCVGSDRLSGVASCTVSTRTSGTAVSYRVTATDRAGNTATASGSYRVAKFGLVGAPFVDGAYNVKVGKTYTLVAYAGSRPTYYDAAVSPRTPTVRDHAFNAAGRGRWALGVTMQKSLRGHTYWNLGVKVGKTMYIVKIRV